MLRALIPFVGEIAVHNHFITNDLYEYYLLEEISKEGCTKCLVHKESTVIEDVDIGKLKPKIISWANEMSPTPGTPNYLRPPINGIWIS